MQDRNDGECKEQNVSGSRRGEGMCPQQGNRKYKGYCTHCFSHLFPTDPLTFQIRPRQKKSPFEISLIRYSRGLRMTNPYGRDTVTAPTDAELTTEN